MSESHDAHDPAANEEGGSYSDHIRQCDQERAARVDRKF